MNDRDVLQRYYFPELQVRAVWARLYDTHQKLQSLARVPAALQPLLGHAACAASMMISGLKGVSRLSLQLQGMPDVRLLFAECTERGEIRGIIKAADHATSSGEWNGQGVLALNLEPHVGERYQGLVALDPAGLAQSFEHYFRNSEQLPTRILLASNDQQSTGLLLQKVASVGGASSAVDDDGWNRIEHLFETLQTQELLDCDSEQLMRRLFNQEVVQSIGVLGLRHHCSCSAERVALMLQSLGETEAMLATEPDGFTSIVCEFCNADYRFDRVDIAALFHSPIHNASTQTSERVQ